jgi:hypothetical protein
MGPIPCDTCILRTACPYYQLFEAPVPTNAPPLLQKTGKVPHAFIIEPDTDGKRRLQTGETFTAGLTLLGPAIRSLPYFLMAFQLFGRAGIGRAKAQFALAAAEAMSSEGTFVPYFDGNTGLAPGFPPVLDLNTLAATEPPIAQQREENDATSHLPLSNLPLADLQTFQNSDPPRPASMECYGDGAGQGVGTTPLPLANLQTDNPANCQTVKQSNRQTVEPDSIQIHLQTPLRLKSRGDLVTRLTPREFFYHLCQRLSNLLFLYAEPSGETWDFKPLLAEAEKLDMRATLRWWDWERYSARQQTAMNFGGLIGGFELSGPPAILEKFLPLLKMGEWLHVGKGTTFGLGKYKVCKYASMQVCKYASMQVCKYASGQVCKWANRK